MTTPKVDPYQPCPCGSGRKYKFCCRAKELAISNESSIALIKNSVAFPVAQCIVSENWQEQGLANIFVVRQLPSTKYIFGAYLLDLLCLGLKDTFCNANIPDAAMRSMIAQTGQNFVPIDYEDARSIIFGGIEFASKLGFSPNLDWKDSKHIVESDRHFEHKFEFGRHGKPFYIQGPHDDPVEITSKLSLK